MEEMKKEEDEEEFNKVLEALVTTDPIIFTAN